MMKRNFFATLLIAVTLVAFSANAFAFNDEDTDTRIVDAEVVEVTDARISVMARTGVEHVIAVHSAKTKILVDGKTVALKDVRQGDLVTIELDAASPMKLAKNIQIVAGGGSQVARSRR